MSLLSVPALAGKEIGVLLLPYNAVLMYLQDNYGILGYSHTDKNELFYMFDRQNQGCTWAYVTKDSRLSAMVSIARENVSEEAKSPSPTVDGKDDSCTARNNKNTTAPSNLEISSDFFPVRMKQSHSETKSSKELQKLCPLLLGHALPIKSVRSFDQSWKLPHVKCSRIDCDYFTQ